MRHLPISSAVIGLLLLAQPSPARTPDLDGSPPAIGATEAKRLYERANDYVNRVQEGNYSYDYLQFYWKRAQSYVDRARRVYPDSPTAQALAAGELTIGPYPLDYFKERVLYHLERKVLAAFDAVNCAIFLYGLDESRSDDARNDALESILEVMAREQRWGEVLVFPVLDEHRALLLGTVFRVAADYGQTRIVKQLFAQTPPARQAAAHFWPLYAEAQVLLGEPSADIATLVHDHPQDEIKFAVLRAMVRREVLLQRMKALNVPIRDSISTMHFSLQRLGVWYDVEQAAAAFFPGDESKARPILAIYRAAQGQRPAEEAPDEAHVAYLRFLADHDRFGEIESYARLVSADPDTALACRLAAIEFQAEAGHETEAENDRAAFSAHHPRLADKAELAEFRGRAAASDPQLIMREKTFATLPIHDPCVLARAMMEWSLTPNRSVRGAAPWDSVVYKFSPGFDHLPKPASTVVSDAASVLKPY